MTWTKRFHNPDIQFLSCAVSDGETAYLRCADNIWAIQPDSLEIKWKSPISNDHQSGYKSILLIGEILIYVYSNNNSSKSEIRAIKKKDGSPIWDRPINWHINFNLGGIFSIEDYLFFAEDDNENAILHKINPQNGKILESFHIPTPATCGNYGDFNPSIVTDNSYCYFAAVNKGVYYFPKDNPKEISLLKEGNPVCLSCSKSQLFCLWEATSYSISSFDTSLKSETNSFTFPKGQIVREIRATEQGTNTLLISPISKGGIIIFQAESLSIVGKVGETNNWGVISQTIIGSTLIAVGFDIHDSMAAFIEFENGNEISDYLGQNDDYAQNTVFNIHGEAWFDGWDGLLIYAKS